MKFHFTDVKVCVRHVRSATSIIIGPTFVTEAVTSHPHDFQHNFWTHMSNSTRTYACFQQEMASPNTETHFQNLLKILWVKK